MLTFLTKDCEVFNNVLASEDIIPGEYDRADLVDIFMTEKEAKYYRQNNNFSGGTTRKQFNTVMDSFCKWHYDKKKKRCVVEEVFASPPIVKRNKNYREIDREIAESLMPLLLTEIDINPHGFKEGIFILDLSKLVSFHNDNYNIFKTNRFELAEYYGTTPEEVIDFGYFVSTRRNAIFKQLINICEENEYFKAEECWISQKVKHINRKEGKKLVVKEIKDRPRKALQNHIKFYEKITRQLKKELGIPKDVNPYFTSHAQQFKTRLSDELYNSGICSFHKGYVFANIDSKKIKEEIKSHGRYSADKIYKKVRKLLVDSYAVNLGEDATEDKLKHFRIYVDTVVGTSVAGIRLDLIKMGRDPREVLKIKSDIPTKIVNEENIITERRW